MELIPESIMGMLLDAGMFILVLELLRGADTQKENTAFFPGRLPSALPSALRQNA